MNAQNAHEYLPLVQAIADGKKIQLSYKTCPNDWYDADEIDFFWEPSLYRIKPEPRTFEIVRSKLTGDIYSAETYEGNSPNWEYITVQEVLK